MSRGPDESMHWCYMGQVDYRLALDLQLRLKEAIALGHHPDVLLLLEHPPVITLGRSANISNVLASEEERALRGVEVVHIARGGDVTYHGPGQLVGYPLRRIGRAVKPHVQGMVEALVTALAGLGINGWWDDQRPGVWTGEGKIAAVGVDATGGVAMHGFALNISTQLDDYRMIVPCGYQAPVTSVQKMIGAGATPRPEEMASVIAKELGSSYGCQLVEISAEKLVEELS
jgi:lipoyl(octanoyl) transferase